MIDICENTYCLKLPVMRAKEWWALIQGKGLSGAGHFVGGKVITLG
jgi:hypothetical protein